MIHVPVDMGHRITWIGVNDRQSALFEGIWPLPNGVSYNSYVVGDEKIALIDSVKRTAIDEFLGKLREAMGPDKSPDYLVVNHLEPDHSGALPILLDLYPEMEVVGTRKTAEFLEHLYRREHRVKIVDDGDELSLGKVRLQFLSTPMVHWPETMMTYVPEAKALFSGDAFGGFGSLEGGIFDDVVDVEYFEDEILRYFSNIIGKYAATVQKAIAKLATLDVAVVAPTHGIIWRKDPQEIIRLYDRWSRHEAEPGVVVAYGSMYGNSERMMQAIVCGLAEEGMCKVRVHDVSRSHHSFILRDAWRYRGLILGSPTYDTGLFPHMDALVELLRVKKLTGRDVGVFGSYGWTGGATEALRQFVRDNKLDLVEPVVEARFAATAEQLEQCRRLGRAVARRILDRTTT